MRFYEFADPEVTKLVAVSDQLKTDLETGEADPNMVLPDFLQYLKKYDIFLDKTDLYNMIKVLPLKNLISNIQGEKIIFKGFGSEEAPPEEESKKIVATMAQQAASK
jgi:hypothetical protein